MSSKRKLRSNKNIEPKMVALPKFTRLTNEVLAKSNKLWEPDNALVDTSIDEEGSDPLVLEVEEADLDKKPAAKRKALPKKKQKMPPPSTR